METMAITGGELLVRTLEKYGVTTIFGLHGAHLETIFQACLDHKIRIVDVRHEVAAGHAAEGYARARRTLGVAMVTAGPGFTNVLSSIASAYLDRTPVLYISGASGLRDAETNTLQSGIDQVAIARPMTKWATQITKTDQIPRLVAQAIRMATSGPTGPVLLDMPSDVLGATVEENEVTIPETIGVEVAPLPPQHAVGKALELLAAARRPVLMVGVGAWQAAASEPLRAFVEATGIPVFSDFQAHGLLPSNHPLYGGTFHKMADLSASDGRPDVVLALGVRLGLFTLGGGDKLIPKAAKFIHVEIDPKEVGRLRDVDVPIVADPAQTLRVLGAVAQGRAWPDFSKWRRMIEDARTTRRAGLAEALNRSVPPIHPYQAVTAIVESLPENTIVVGDGAEAYHWLNETIRQNEPGSYLTHGFLGIVGFGIGLAIGAQAARPEHRVLCTVGDGAVGFTIAEFDTMVKHRLPIVVVVMNNQSWAASQHFQEIVSGANRVTGTRLSNAKYHDVAVAFGARGKQVTRIEDLRPAIEAAFASGEPYCINVAIDLAPLPPELHLLMSR
jgi:acetolactate synthase-1/2/3 large subunit